ncbi:MAG: DUF721 domain-containing protein [Candidatus Thiosymbion ectosymbiont of Robbea hypermnestra]|nr:DUF721 domain-containing protein [Candidatus Thiosymbion ectosymbiont of Robbea hypermnestra]
MSKHLRHVCRFLRYDGKTADYLAAIERQRRLLREVRATLPAPLDEHCLHASLEAGALTLLTDSPVWSSRLRFFAPEIERRLAPRYGAIGTCRIRIRPQVALPSSTAPGKDATSRLSATTAQHLLEAAAGIEDTQIAAALRRLAKTHAGT